MTKYFQDLNYSMANEDTNFEFEVVKKNNYKTILGVGGSGARVIPFLALGINKLTISDISKSQLLFIELKLLAIKELSHKEFLDFYLSSDKNLRETIFKKLSFKDELSKFFYQLQKTSSDIPMFFWGKWEKTFKIFSMILKTFFSEKTRIGLFEAKDPYEYYKKNIKGFRWNLVLSLAGNKAVFNSLLYKGDFVKKNIEISYFDFYFQAFERLFRLDVKKSHFLQLCFFGDIKYHAGLPLEFQKDVFDKIKLTETSVEYVNAPFYEIKGEYDFISLSDVPSYLDGELEKEYLSILAKNNPKCIVERYYLRRPEVDSHLYLDKSSEYTELSQKELVQMYEIKVWKAR